MNTDEKFMARCLQLARMGRCGAAPNPMVGAVIVHDGRIIGEGYHIRCGGPHAEVNAVASVRDERLLASSVLYVSLEPCAHWGKTPPCADLIIRKGIRRVVAGCIDPFEKVAGRGIQKLREAGVAVQTGVLENQCLWLNRRFFTYHTLHRPYVTLKWAQSADGFIDAKRKDESATPFAFSTPFTQILVHRMRAHNQAVLAGSRTALADNPLLTNRLWPGPQPLRLVIDRKGSLPASLHLFRGGNTRVYADRCARTPDYACQADVCVVRLDFRENVLGQIMNDLYNLGIQSLLVEGGRETVEGFVAKDLWDEARLEISPVSLGAGVPAPTKPAGKTRMSFADGHIILRICSPKNRFAAGF